MASHDNPDPAGEVKTLIDVSQAETAIGPQEHKPAAALRTGRRPWGWVIGAVVVLVGLVGATPWVIAAFNTVSTDDAYVNGHVTFVAPRVAGQVAAVLVDDNNRVRKGDLLVQLDREPYQVQVNIAQSAVDAAEADLQAALAQARSLTAQSRSLRFSLEHAMEDVDNQVALLRSKVATVNSRRASLAKAQADYDRALPLKNTGALTPEEIDRRKEVLSVAQAQLDEALQGVYQVRVALGLPPKPVDSDDLPQVPADLNQTFSSVRQAQASLIQAATQLGVVASSFNLSPKEMIAEFYKRDPTGDIDKIYAKLIPQSPLVRQAQTKLDEAKRNLDQAQLNLRYCDIVAEIDGVVTRRSVNPGNNVTVGQSLMAVRSLTEIWIDANFKETQLRKLRIGQPVASRASRWGPVRRWRCCRQRTRRGIS
jgi:membrane fusion protein (multidrug efflux system)